MAADHLDTFTSEWVIDSERSDRTMNNFSPLTLWGEADTCVSDQLSTHRTLQMGDEQDTFYLDERDRWTQLNAELRHAGLTSVHFISCSEADELTAGVCLSADQSAAVRKNLESLLEDVRRRRTLVRELVQANNQLKEELKNTCSLSKKFENKALDLKSRLEAVSRRAEELQEEKVLLERSGNVETQKLKGTKTIATQRSKTLEKRCRSLEEELIRYRARIAKLEQGEVERAARTAEVFRRVKHRDGKKRDPLDCKLLDVIDAYERQLSAMRREMNFVKSLKDEDDEEEEEEGGRTSSPVKAATVEASYRDLIQELRDQLTAAASRNSELEEAADLVRLELQARPALKDYRNLVYKLKKAESTMKKHGISRTKESERGEQQYSTLLEDLDYLPLAHCRQLLRDCCQCLQLEDVGCLSEEVLQLREQVHTELLQMRSLRGHLLRIVGSSSAPRFIDSDADTASSCQSPDSSPDAAPQVEMTDAELISRFELWLDQLSSLPELCDAVSRLASAAFPWKPAVSLSPHRADLWHVVGALDALTESPKSPSFAQLESAPASTLAALVEHFQRLFEVPQLGGVYPRMTELYQRLGEAHNALSSLRALLGLPGSASVGAVVEAVTAVVRSTQASVSEQLRGFLQADDIEPLLHQMEEYDEFFPLFQAMVQQLQTILNLKRVDQIVPAVRNLKLLADSKQLY